MKRDWTADAIKVAAVATAIPRWVAALLLAEGLAVPGDWLWWWLPLAAALNAGMALTEGLAFAYVFGAWKRAAGWPARVLFALAILSAGAFVGVLAPYIAASVEGVALARILSAPGASWAWGVCVAASTVVIVASVGYAQKAARAPDSLADSASAREMVELRTERDALQAQVDAARAVAAGVAAFQVLTPTQQARVIRAQTDGDAPDARTLARVLSLHPSTVRKAYAEARPEVRHGDE